MSDPFDDDPFDEQEEISKVEKNEEVVTPPTIEELKARMKNRRNQDRASRIGKMQQEKTSSPLQRIHYCENKNCLKIMQPGQQKVCSSCHVFTYCSKECQLEDWKEVHKNICGSKVSEEDQKLKNLYVQANLACDKIEKTACHGKQITVLHEDVKTNPPACIFATIATKSNVLHYSEYVKNPIYSTTELSVLGDFSRKVLEAQRIYSDHKIFLISVMLDRVKKNENTQCCMRMYLSPENSYGQTMAAPKNGQGVKVMKKFQRVKK